jgi:hypothetical protein
MYCPSCGAESSFGLNYCKQCGANLASQPGVPEPGINYTNFTRRLSGMFWAIAVFAMASFTVLFGVTIPLTIFGAGKQVIIPMFVFGSAGIGAIAAMLIKQLSRLITMAQEAERSPKAGQLKANSSAARAQLHPQPPLMSSVTEHTTRNFEPVYREPGARE